MRLLVSLGLLSIYLCTPTEGLSSTGKNVCHHTTTERVSSPEAHSRPCHNGHGGMCTIYRQRYIIKSKTVYECCPGWKSTNNIDCNIAICYGKDNTNGACHQRGSCVAPDKCSCHTGYTGSQCEKCLDARGDPDHSVWWQINSHPDCALTCSWKNQWCWPGDCPDRRLRTSCKCRKGFTKKDGGSSYTKCDLVEKPQLLTCQLGITDEHHNVRNSTHGSHPGCQYESDTYVNLNPTSVHLVFSAKFDDLDLRNPPNYIYQQGYGLVYSQATLSKVSITGLESSLSSVMLSGGSSCSQALGSTSTSPSLTCSLTITVPTDMYDGERLCVLFSATGGGFFRYQDFDRHHIGTQITSRQKSTKHLCFRFDMGKPVHCSKLRTGHCSSQPLELSTRITRTGLIHVKTSGWTDPVPHGGNTDAVSGLKSIRLMILNTVDLGNMIDVQQTPLKGLDFTYNTFTLDKSIHLPDKPGLYAVILEVHDKAGNIQSVRRFVLYDKASKLMTMPSKPLEVVSATQKSNYQWQANHGPLCIDWKGRYYNSEMRDNNPLSPVRPQVGLETDYDQTSGVLSTYGTPNIDGIVEAKYSLSVNQGVKSHWTLVPHFTKQSLCITPTLLDGQTYDISVEVKDFLNNTLEESARVCVDSTVPELSNMWLVKDGNKQVYVHDSLDLSTMVFHFDAKDPHSGIESLQWYLGIKDSTEDLGHGVLPVEKLSGQACASSFDCYCPSVGECQYHNHTVKMTGLLPNKIRPALNYRAIYFTVTATNGALMSSSDHLDILVEASPHV